MPTKKLGDKMRKTKEGTKNTLEDEKKKDKDMKQKEERDARYKKFLRVRQDHFEFEDMYKRFCNEHFNK